MSGKFEWKSDTYYGLEKVLSFPMNLIPFFREKKDVHNSESLFMHRISSAKQTLYDSKSCKVISVSMYQKFLWSFFDPEENNHTLTEISILNRWVSVGGKLRAKRRRLAHQLRNICCFFFSFIISTCLPPVHQPSQVASSFPCAVCSESWCCHMTWSKTRRRHMNKRKASSQFLLSQSWCILN
jgi:hypothetical protein